MFKRFGNFSPIYCQPKPERSALYKFISAVDDNEALGLMTTVGKDWVSEENFVLLLAQYEVGHLG